MEDRKQADVGAQVFGIGGYLQKGLRTGLEQELIEGLLVLQYQLGKLMRQSKDNMDIGDRQKFIVASRDPAIARPILALGAVAIPAAVVGDGLIATARTMVAMPAESGGAAACDRLQHLAVRPVIPDLARYTHRVAITNHRLLAFDGEQVTFRWKDYAHGNKNRTMTLSAPEFLRRFLLHVLPRGLVRIRRSDSWPIAVEPNFFPFVSACSATTPNPTCRKLFVPPPSLPSSAVPTVPPP
jgi:hypothetical protein